MAVDLLATSTDVFLDLVASPNDYMFATHFSLHIAVTIGRSLFQFTLPHNLMALAELLHEIFSVTLLGALREHFR